MNYTCRYFVTKPLLKKTHFLSIFKSNTASWSVVFFGGDDFSLFCLKALHKQMKLKSISNMEVVVVNERSPVYAYSVSNDIKTHFWPPDLSEGIYDFGVIASFGKLIPRSLLKLFPLGIINVHGSLLPKYRGGMPIIHAIKNGETLTGITVTKIKEDKFDVGDIILQKSCSIGENEFHPSLYKRLTQLGSKCLLEVISGLPKCLETSYPQPEKEVSYAPRLKKEAAIVKWKSMTALEIFNLHRALLGTFELISMWKGKQVKFVCLFLSNLDSKVGKEDAKPEPGSFTFNSRTKFFYVQCKDKPITVCTIKYKSKMYKASAFHNGYLHNLPKQEWKFES